MKFQNQSIAYFLNFSRFLRLVILVFIALWAACAQVGTPTGGPKDETPPKILVSEPPNRSTNFDDGEIVLTFDEYIQLQNINENLVTSPPLGEDVETILKNKKLIVKFHAPLADSTTYNLNFGEGIVDFNEGNVLKNFQYAFSTGDVIDSLQIAGKIVDAFTHQGKENIWLMAYTNPTDSAPYQRLPDFICRTNAQGEFLLSNLRKNSYHLFALKDGNMNLLFDLPNETIAFLDTLVVPQAFTTVVNDTIQLFPDSIPIDELSADTLLTDSLVRDSVVRRAVTRFSPDSLMLFAFEEDHAVQYITKYDRPEKGHCYFSFNRKVRDSLIINLLQPTPPNDWYRPEWNAAGDSVTVWLQDSTVYQTDTLIFELNYERKDSLGNYVMTSDTLNLTYEFQNEDNDDEEEDSGRRDQRQIHQNPDTLLIKTNIQNGMFEKYQQLLITASHPLVQLDTSLIQLIEIDDTLQTTKPFELSDSTTQRHFSITADFDDELKYRLIINKACCTDMFNLINDSVAVDFLIRPDDFYGDIILKISNLQNNTIFHILDENNEIVREHYVTGDSTLYINYLPEATYQIKAISDKNGDKQWTTGHYINRRQPERVRFYSVPIEIKAGWGNELEWDFALTPMNE